MDSLTVADPARRRRLAAIYRDGLLDDTLPFWTRHAVDREHGGFLFSLDRDGSVVDTDKGVWQHGRFAWLLATLYCDVESREEWLELARHGIDFLRAHAFDGDGRMFFQLTRDGRPLRKRRYVFTETFGAIAFAAWARASGDERAADEARALLDLVLAALEDGTLEPKVDPRTRPMQGMAVPMILIATAQELRKAIAEPRADAIIDDSIERIRRDFMKPDLEAVLETTGPGGEILDCYDGRLLNPGHAIEAAWFVLAEAAHRGGDDALVDIGTSILDWMWRRGWDEEHGGLFYFTRPATVGPVQEYWHDMKFWWPHNEAILATLLAHRADRREPATQSLARRGPRLGLPPLRRPEHGEWFGYLHRDGRLSWTGSRGTCGRGPSTCRACSSWRGSCSRAREPYFSPSLRAFFLT